MKATDCQNKLKTIKATGCQEKWQLKTIVITTSTAIIVKK